MFVRILVPLDGSRLAERALLIVPARFEDPTEALAAELGREHFDTPQPSLNR